jgi:hypothetical protein
LRREGVFYSRINVKTPFCFKWTLNIRIIFVARIKRILLPFSSQEKGLGDEFVEIP